MNTTIFRTILSTVIILLITTADLFSFGSGAHLQLRSDFGGTLTLPEISDESLYYLNNRATEMNGTTSNLLMGGEVED